MTGTIAFMAVRPAVYKRARGVRLWRSALCAGALIAIVLPNTGCSTQVPLGATAPKEDDKPQHTGAVAGATTGTTGGEELPLPPDSDLAYAKRAAAEVLARGGKDASQSWENPRSGARGTVTPLASAYRVEGGALCRDFLASYVSDGGAESWLQGEACRAGRGEWQVRRLKPWRS